MARDVSSIRPEEEEEVDEEEDDDEEEEDDDEEEEEEMVLDEFGRIPGGILPDNPCYPDLDYSFRSFASFVDASDKSFEKLVVDSKAAFTARQQKGKKYSSGETYWVAASATPRTALEKLAKSVFDFHTKDLTGGEDYDEDKSGAEWWTLVLDNQDDIGLHWDRDYAMESDSGIFVHPHLSTVTYLTSVGGPTIGLDRVSPMQKGEPDEILGPVPQAFLSRPLAGKHIAFDGRLLHGAPADANAWHADKGGEGTRVTFLVNVWLNHVPETAEPFPEEKLGQLTGTDAVLHPEKEQDTPEIVDVPQVKADGASIEVVTMKFKLEGKVKLVMPLPLEHLRAQSSKAGLSFQLKFEGADDDDDEAEDEDGEEGGEEEEKKKPVKTAKRGREEGKKEEKKEGDGECVCEIVEDNAPPSKQSRKK